MNVMMCDKVTIEARTRFQCKLNDALKFTKFIDEHSLFIHHFKSSFIFTFHSSFLKFIHHLHFSSIVNEHIINASNNLSHSNYQRIMVVLPPSPYVVHWGIFDQVVWIIFEDWIFVTNVAKYVMQWLQFCQGHLKGHGMESNPNLQLYLENVYFLATLYVAKHLFDMALVDLSFFWSNFLLV